MKQITKIHTRIEELEDRVLALNKIFEPSETELKEYGTIVSEMRKVEKDIDSVVAKYKKDGSQISNLTALCDMRAALSRVDDAILKRADLLSHIAEENMSVRLKHEKNLFLREVALFDIKPQISAAKTAVTNVIVIKIDSIKKSHSIPVPANTRLAAAGSSELAPVATHVLYQKDGLEVIARYYPESKKCIIKVLDIKSGEISTSLDGEKVSLDAFGISIKEGTIENGKLIIKF